MSKPGTDSAAVFTEEARDAVRHRAAQPEISYLSIVHDSPGSGDKLSESLQVKDELERFRGAWQILADKPAAELRKLTEQTSSSSGKTFEELAFKQLSPEHAGRLLRMISEKSQLQIPEGNKENAENLMKEGSPLKAGEHNTVTLANGRSYDVYIPKTVHAYTENGEKKVPLIAAIHGVVPGFDNFRHQKDATGLNLVADQLGIAVVYPLAQGRKFDGTKYNETITSHLGALGRFIDRKMNDKPVYAWNSGDKDLMPSDKSYSDYDYMNSVLDDLKSRFSISEQIGIVGHSDGGRFGQIFSRDFPEKVAAIATITSTWMKDSKEPQLAKPFWGVLAGQDNVLALEGGAAAKGMLYDAVLPSKSEDSLPLMQEKVWAKAGDCRNFTEKKENGVQIKQYSGAGCDVRVDFIEDSGHTVPDWRNLQESHYQYYVFKTVVNHQHNYSHDMAAWLKDKIIKSGLSKVQ